MQGNYFLRMMLPLQKLSGIFRHAIALMIATFFLQLFTLKWSIVNLAVAEIAHHAERERETHSSSPQDRHCYTMGAISKMAQINRT